ncbi:hypothetical protein [Parachitinimonas caeni]|uniref:Delta-60 repeat domain-containing protein n=1 Tax=Parachitinimonas caeni TaxID=3031301 RepID=A0ABT7DVL4_9NEIS|nr:hypothetical protein [Parachitinimonas caeni]MDK2124102.1 hypothetical protein [Parachitinimonas caeni]
MKRDLSFPLRLGTLALATLTVFTLTACSSGGDSGSSSGSQSGGQTGGTATYRSGDLDRNFATAGTLQTQFAQAPVRPLASRVLADGKQIIVSESNDGSGLLIQITRLLADGKIDTGFGSEGRLLVPPTGDTSELSALTAAFQTDNQIIVATTSTRVGREVPHPVTLHRIKLDSGLDRSFANSGSLLVPNSHNVAALAIDSQSRILALSRDTLWVKNSLTRFSRDGAIDTAFASGGTLELATEQQMGVSTRSLALDASGKITVAGLVKGSSGKRDILLVRRYLADGTIDASLNASGQILLDKTGLHADSPLSLLTQADGIYLAGHRDGDKLGQLALLRFNEAGTQVKTFDTPFSDSNLTNASPPALLGSPQGGIIIAAPYVTSAGTTEAGVVKLSVQGANSEIITGIGRGLSGLDATSTGLTIASSRRTTILLVPVNDKFQVLANAGNDDLGMTRFAQTVLVDTSYGRNGTNSLEFGAGTYFKQANVTSNAGDRVFMSLSNAYSANLAALDSIGRRVGAFDSVTLANELSAAAIYSIAATADGGLAVVGARRNAANFSVKLWRLDSNGRRVSSFGQSGEMDISQLNATNLASLSDGSLLLSGRTYHRISSAGKVVASEPLRGNPVLQGGTPLALPDGGFVTLLWDSNQAWIKRFKSDELEDTSFGQGGTAMLQLAQSESATGWSMMRQSDGKLLVSVTLSYGSQDQRLRLFRLQANGQVDTSFGSNGSIEILGNNRQQAGFNHRPRQLAVNTEGLIYVVANRSDAQTSHSSLLRYQTNGQLDARFGNGGEVVLNLGEKDEPLGLALQAGRPVVLAQATIKGKPWQVVSKVLP